MPKKSKILAIVLALAIVFSYAPIFNIPVAHAANNTGMVVYGSGVLTSPKYRTWSGTNFSAQGDAAVTAATVQYVVVKEATTRDEKILGTGTQNGLFHFQVWNGSTWNSVINPANVGTSNDDKRGFDIAYEQLTGRGLIVYEKDTVSDSAVYYQTWNGSAWSGEQTLTFTSGVAGNVLWVKLEPKPNTNEIMLVAGDNQSDLRGIVWNGSSWVNEKLLTDSLSVSHSDAWDSAYENSSGDALVMYGTGTTLDFWTYINGVWTDGTGEGVTCAETGTANACVNPGSGAVHQLKLASGRGNNYIAMDLITVTGPAVVAQMWNGAQWLGTPTAVATWKEAAAELPSLTVRSRTVESAFETAGNRFMFAFADANALLVDYFFYDLDDATWYNGNGTTAITDIDSVTTQTPTWSDDVETVHLDANPNDNSEIMITGVDLLNSVRTFLWNGSSWTTPTQSAHGVTGLDYMDGAYFIWDLTNNPPVVPTNSTPSNGATNQVLTPTLTSSAFSDSDADLHAASRWQITTTAGNYSSPVFNSGEDTVNKTSITVSPALTPNTTYYWHVHYKDNSGKPNPWSDFSAEFSFTTSQPPVQPTNSSPLNGATTNTVSPTLTSSAFSDPDAGDTHSASQWQVDNNADFSSPTFDSGTDTVNKTSVVPTGLSWNVTYNWRVRHRDNNNVFSNYSVSTTFTPDNVPPAAPTNSTPTAGATNQNLSPVLTASSFSDSDGHSHLASQWLVDNNADFLSPEFDSGETTTNLVSITVSPALSAGTTYNWKVRYKDNSGAPDAFGAYSAATTFTTTQPPATPTNSSPSNGANVNTLTPTLTSSAYSDPDGDPHQASQWQVDNNANFSSPEFDSGTDTSNKTSIVVPSGLVWDATYNWRVRHQDSVGVFSSYSASTTFNTVNLPPATPTNIAPTDGAAVFVFPTLVSSNFSDPNGSAHAASQWQIDDDADFSSLKHDTGEDTANLTSFKVPTTIARDKTYYWRVRHKDNSGSLTPWSSYSAGTTVTISDAAIDIKISGQGSYNPGNSIELLGQLQDLATNASVNDATLTINIYNPSKTKVVNAAAMTYLAGSNGLYTYTYTAPSTLGSYIFDMSATASSTFAATPQRKGYNASTFSVAQSGGSVTNLENALIGATGTADSGTTLTLVDNALTQADDFWNGMTLIITGGTNAGEMRQIADFDAASDTITVDSAFTLAIDNTSTYLIRRDMNWAARVWNYTSRTLTSFGTLVADIWSYSTRLLTGKTLTGGGSLVTETYLDTALAALNNISAANVWSYATRGLTEEVNLTSTSTDAIWEYALTQIGDAGSVGKLLKDNINATVSSRSSHTAADVWSAVTRTLTSNANFNDPTSAEIAAAVWSEATRTLTNYGNNITAQNVWDVLSANLTTTGSIGKQLADNVDVAVSTRASLANQQAQWTVWLSDFNEILAGNTYRTKLWVLNYASIPTDANTTPTVTIYDVLRNTVVSGVAMTKLSTGIYEYTYSVAAGATQGVWETEASAEVEVGKTIKVSDFWEVEGSPAQVLVNSISDSTVPSIAASVTISNEGSAGFEYQYEWCVVSAENNACGGGDDVYYASAAKFIQAGQDFNTTLTATVSNTGIYWFKVVVTYGTEKSGASRIFTATTEPVSTPVSTSGGGGGGGSGGGGIITQPTSTGLSSGSAFCGTFSAVCDILNAILARIAGVETKMITLTAGMVNLETRMAALERKISAVPVPAPQIIREQTIIRQPTSAPLKNSAKVRLESTLIIYEISKTKNL